MRTKALLVGAIIGAASLTSSMAQVYSVNIVGYINVPIYTGWNLIANQLNNSAGNTVANLFGTAPSSISVFVFNGETQKYDGSDYDSEYQEWTKPGLVVAPGQGCYILAGENFNFTFVGEVMTGPQTTTLYTGWNLIAPIVPQDGNITTLGYVPSTQGDSIFWFNGATQKYYGADYDGEYQEWTVPPVTLVGQGFFALRSSGGTWSANFSVSGN